MAPCRYGSSASTKMIYFRYELLLYQFTLNTGSVGTEYHILHIKYAWDLNQFNNYYYYHIIRSFY